MAPSALSKPFNVELPPTPEPGTPPRRLRQQYKFSTLCATVENPSQKDQYGSSSVPIYQTATFKGMDGQYDYSRSGNPTRSHLEHHIAKISSAAHAFAVSSGMAALDIILRILKPGDEIIAGDDLYGGTNRLLNYIKIHGGITVHHVDTTDPTSLYQYVNPEKTAMVLLESPTNPLLKIVDIALVSQEVKERAPRAVVVVDNTMMSPYLQRPLEHGADIVYDSATKYLSGHHDLMAGVITCNRDDLAKQMAFTINSVGNALTPIDSFLLLRGTKTLAIRMDRQQATANVVANYLHNLGFKVHYPGLLSHPNRDVHHRIADGSGAVLSFETGDKEMSERIVSGTRLWGISVSFGCVNSLISMPCVMSHASIDAATRAARGLPEDLIRLCVGIEDCGDLLDDLEHALLNAKAAIYNAQNILVRTPAIDPATLAINLAAERLALKNQKRWDDNMEWFVSAPGKVILFGEHAVVHGVTAIAASIDLRCYGLTTPRNDGKLSVHFCDIDDFRQEWDINFLPWGKMVPIKDEHPDILDQLLIDALLNGPLTDIDSSKKHARTATLAFLYMYMTLSRGGMSRPSFHFTARSTLPLGAGLGSSASFSTCAATTLLLLHRAVSLPSPPAITQAHNTPLHTSHQGRRAIPPDVSARVNRWAFIAEKILHGNPSGVDNSVAVYGGALAYTRAGFNKPSNIVPIQGFKSLKFLLTNTKVPRDTKKLVAGVGELKRRQPETVEQVLAEVQNISDEARRALGDPEMSRDLLLKTLSTLMDANHSNLVTLGVSHPSLEAVREITRADGLSTKLTGAGGGGCSVTLVPDEYDSAHLNALFERLKAANFQPYVTSVGGSGLGVLSPYAHHRKSPTGIVRSLYYKYSSGGIATPPQTPGTPDPDAPMYEPLFPSFESKRVNELSSWAEGLGRWLYV